MIFRSRANAVSCLIYAVSLAMVGLSPIVSIALALLGSGISLSHLIRVSARS
jgi:hypothetical protein